MKQRTRLLLLSAVAVLVVATVVVVLSGSDSCVDESMATVACSSPDAFAVVLTSAPAVASGSPIDRAVANLSACPDTTFGTRLVDGRFWCLDSISGDRWADHDSTEYGLHACLAPSSRLDVPRRVACADDTSEVLGWFPLPDPPVNATLSERILAYVNAVSDVCPAGRTMGPSFYDWEAGGRFVLCTF